MSIADITPTTVFLMFVAVFSICMAAFPLADLISDLLTEQRKKAAK